jgi:hypothetical protein
MKTYTPEELKEVLAEHSKWLRSEEGGKRADLRSADLSSADLRSADLRSADLRYANLRYANLSYANLSSADLRYANLRYANLSYANLSSANLRYANLSYANLSYANLSSADLSYADRRDLRLCGVVGNMGVIRSIQLETYEITYTFEVLQIGCERHTIEEWKTFNDERIIRMDGKEALKFWRKWKDTIMQLIEMAPAEKWEYEPAK